MSAASLSSDGSVGSGGSDRSQRLRLSGGYRTLRSFRASTIVYEATVASHFVDKRSRTNDQMVQAARRGRPNFAEGSRASAASSQTELRFVNVARASLDELLLDYEDSLRQRGFRQWGKDDLAARAVLLLIGRIGRIGLIRPIAQPTPAGSINPTPPWSQMQSSCLIHQTNYLLDLQIRTLEHDFIHEGGYSEQLAAARIQHRQQQNRSDRSDSQLRAASAAGNLCGKPLVVRTARQGPRVGSQFGGCSAYPACKGTQPLRSGS